MDHLQLTTTAQLTGALVLAYEEAVSAYVTWRRASIACTRYRRRALATFCDTDPTIVGFCAVSSSLAAAAVHIRETYDAAFASLGDQFAQGTGAYATTLRDQLLTLKQGTSDLTAASPTSRPGPLNLFNVIQTSETVRHTVVRTLSALHRRLALNWPSMPAELLVPKVRAQKVRTSDPRYRPDDRAAADKQRRRTSQPSSLHTQQEAHHQHHQFQPNPQPQPQQHRQHRPGTPTSPRQMSLGSSISQSRPATGMRGEPAGASDQYAQMVPPSSSAHYGPTTLEAVAPRRKPVPDSSRVFSSERTSAPAPSIITTNAAAAPPALLTVSSKPHQGVGHGPSSLHFNSNPPSPPLTPDFPPEFKEEAPRHHQYNHNPPHPNPHHYHYDSHNDNTYDHDYAPDSPDSDSEHDDEDDYGRRRNPRDSVMEANHSTAGTGTALTVAVNNSVFSTFCPAAMSLQVDRDRPVGDAPYCSTCGHCWRHPGGQPMILKDGFRLTERFLAKSHCRPRGGDAQRGAEYGCVLCTSRGRTARYPTSAALGAHINEEHSKWQMLHDRDMI